jgi:hypothetical protein
MSFISKLQGLLQNIGQNNPNLSNALLRAEAPVQAVKNAMLNVPQFTAGSQMVDRIQNPFARAIVGLPVGMFESIVNSPQNYLKGIAQTGLNIGKYGRGEPLKISELLGGAAPTAEAILNFSTLGVGGKLGKEALGMAGKKTFAQLMKESAVSGAKYGGIYGGLGGLQQSYGKETPEMLKNVGLGVGTGALTGAIAGPTMTAILHGGGKLLEKYKQIPPEVRQAGFIKLDEPLGKKKGPLASTIEAKKTSIERMIKNIPENAPVNPKYQYILDKFPNFNPALINDLEARGYSASKIYQHAQFVMGTSAPIRNPDAYLTQALKTNNFSRPATPLSPAGGIPVEPGGIRVKPETISGLEPAAMAKTGEIAGNIEVPTTPVPKPVNPLNEPPRFQPPTEVPSVSKNLKTGEKLIDVLPKPEKIVTPEERGIGLKTGSDYINSKSQNIIDFINENNLNPDDVAKAWDTKEGMATADIATKKAVQMLQNLNDEIYKLRSAHGEKVGYNPHMPRVWENEIAQVEQLFGDENIAFNQVFSDMHRLARTGKGTGYITDPVLAVQTSGLTAIQDYLKPVSEIQRTIADHVAKLEPNKTIDYVTLLAPAEPTAKPVIDAKLPFTIKEDPVTTQNYIFMKIPELKDAFRMVRDAKDLSSGRTQQMMDFAEKGDKQGLVNFIIDITGRNPESAARISGNIDKLGIKNYARSVGRLLSGEWQIQNFADTAAKYEYSNPYMKEFINKTVDGLLKSERIEAKLGEKIMNFVTQRFSDAQILGNIKVALQQSLEVSRIPATTLSQKGNKLGGLKALFKGISKSFLERKRLNEQIGLGAKDVALFSKEKGVLGKIRELGYKPMQMFENWKNTVYGAAGEELGKQQGLTGQALINFARDFAYNYSALQDRASSSMVLKNQPWSRLLFQYSQYKIKTAQAQYDAVAGKKYAEFLGLFASDIFNASVVTALMGIPIKYTLQNILLPFGVGPVMNFALNLGKNAWDAGQSIAQGEPVKESTKMALYKLGMQNIVPAGSQMYKTGTTIQDILKGYSETAGGNIRYMMNNTPQNTAQALLFGPSVLKSNKEFYGTSLLNPLGKLNQPLGANQTAVVKDLLKTSPALATEQYNEYMTARETKKSGEKMVQDLINGKPTPITANVREKAVTGQYTTPQSLMEMIQGEAAQSKINSEVKDLMETKGMTDQVFQQILQNRIQSGQYTPEQVAEAQNSYIRSLDDSHQAEFVQQQVLSGTADWAKLYKDRIVTLAVLKEMERKGYIDDADALWKKVKMTDIYEQRKAAASTGTATMKKLLAANKTAFNKYLTQRNSQRNQLLKAVQSLGTKTKKAKQVTVSSILKKHMTIKAPKMVKMSKLKVKGL